MEQEKKEKEELKKSHQEYVQAYNTLQSLYNAACYNTVLVITRPGLGSQMVIFLLFLYKIILL